MKAIRLNKPGEWEQLDLSEPGVPAAGHALLKIHQIGICGTDLHAFRGSQPFFSYPRILGHELAAEVLAVGDKVTCVKPGDRCTVEPYYNDRIGQAVRLGKPNCGEHLKVLGVHVDGGMCEFLHYPAHLLHPSDQLSNEQLALIEPLAIGCHAVNRAMINSADLVLVIGAGPIGLGAMQFAKLNGARVIAMDLDEQKLGMAREIAGIEDTIVADAAAEDRLRALLDGDLPTVVLDATGSPTSMMKTFDYAAYGGTIVFIGLFVGDVVFNDPNFHKKELTLMASRAALGSDFTRIIDLVSQGIIDPASYITHRIAFDRITTDFKLLLQPDSSLVKAVINL